MAVNVPRNLIEMDDWPTVVDQRIAFPQPPGFGYLPFLLRRNSLTLRAEAYDPATGELRPLTEGEFASFQLLIHREAGIYLSEVKKALSAGSYNAAPSTLTGGAALQRREPAGGAARGAPRTTSRASRTTEAPAPTRRV